MDLVSGVVLYGILWFLTLFVVLPLRLKTQDEAGEIVPGTPAGAPAEFNVRRKMLITTVGAAVVWVAVALVISSGVISIRMFDVNHTLPPVSANN